MMKRPIPRRTVLRLGGSLLVAGVAAWLTGCSRSGQAQPAPPSPTAGTSAPPPAPDASSAAPSPPTGTPDVEIALRATSGERAMLEGALTRVQTLEGEVLAGDARTLQTLPDSYLGPTIRVQRGQHVRIHFTNDIDAETILHWHGLHVPATMDGHPRTAIAPGETYVYDFTVQNRAGTYWYHPHPHGQTGPQVYAGMAGLFLVADEEEQALALPSDEADIPLVIQDRTFDSDNQLVYLPNGMMDQMIGMLGERILVNGQPDYVLSVATRTYRLRLLNGSNSRIYRLAWEDGTPLTVLGSDGGLLAQPVQRDFVVLAPGERVELWADFRERAVGEELHLRSLEMEGLEMHGGMMGGGRGGMMGGQGMQPPTQALPNGAAFPVLTVRVEQTAQDDTTLPPQLSHLGLLAPADAINQNAPRTFTATMSRMAWLLNGRTFEMEAVAEDEIVQLGTTEMWAFFNAANQRGGMGGGMMRMAHPIHVHGMQFQIMERTPPDDATLQAHWEALQPGMVDEGWKDTFLLMPGERVTIVLRFADYDGLYLYHCHNLEHEDGGMMRNYRVQASGTTEQ